MHEEFWQERWARNEIGFHQDQVNPYLRQHWPALGVEPGAQVLVPLCGKSLDLLWLAGRGQRVLGVELAQRAVEDFFAAQGVEPEVDRQGEMPVYRHGDVEIILGDFFQLRPEQVAGCRALYDRAALIALPADLRIDYVRHLSAILPRPLRGLLVTLEYPQEQMSGPPFSVPAAEVRELFAGAWSVDEIERRDVLAENGKFQQRGVARLDEAVYRLTRD
ncbi:thiopurine S-methyltransferase [Pseudomonas jinjuensis]|uniref:Thiopurine S-methyltransferase n=1 Tax=Pseudomonas jinjuensis TaxID=198616 RepID=A0A1H0FBI7_9PSED|nr:thiopurine S-methyltransferase [Pseudomonas jinjuensis]SDN91819.1 thiopurine S-methyltransferase [Pseudomonas jinjuensis]